MNAIPERVRAANIAAVISDGQVLVVIRLSIDPNDTLDHETADQLGKTLRGTAAWVASRVGGAA